MVFGELGDWGENTTKVFREGCLRWYALQGEGHPGTEKDSVNAEGRRTGRGCTWPWSMAKLPCFWFSILALRGLRRNDYFQIHHRKFKMFWNKRHLPIHMPMTQRRAGLFSLPQHHSLVNSQPHTTRQWLQTSSSAKMCPHPQTPPPQWWCLLTA